MRVVAAMSGGVDSAVAAARSPMSPTVTRFCQLGAMVLPR